MKKEAQGSANDVGYDWDSDVNYLIKEFQVSNPDAGSATNRVKVREITPSGTNDWVYAYTATNSGWNVVLPDGSGSIDLVSTNHATNGFTLTRRYRDIAGSIIAVQTQLFTNYSWGDSLAQEIRGTGGDARTRTLTYYDPDTNAAPFAPNLSHIPLKTVEDADGSWTYITRYSTNGLVVTELRGIDSALTSDTNLCLRIEYSYLSQDAADDLSREPERPRSIQEWWKGTLIRKTFHIYADDYHKVIECPNPTNAIATSGNLITETDYAPGTMAITKRIFPDQTIETHSWSSVDQAETIDVGEDDGSGSVLSGLRTITVIADNGAVLSKTGIDITNGIAGVTNRYTVWSGFNENNQPTSMVDLGNLTNSWAYDCCGLSGVTDADGTTTTYANDALHRAYLSTRWGIGQLKIFDSANRILEEWRIGTNNTSIRKSGSYYDTTGFLTFRTNGLGGVTTIVRSKQTNGFDQIVTTYPDLGTNLQKFLAQGRLERSVGNASAPVRYVYGVTNTTYKGVTRTFQYQMQIKLDSNGVDTGEWEVSCFDALGRLAKTILPGPAESVISYNDLGQKEWQYDSDSVIMLYRYNGRGDQIITATDLDGDGLVANYNGEASGSDRVTSNVSFYLASGATGNSRGMDIRVDDAYVWTTASSAATSRVSRVETSTDGLYSWRTSYKDQSTPITTTSRMAYSSGGNRYLTNGLPSGVTNITTYLYGRAVSIAVRDSSNGQTTKTDIGYDSHGRRFTSTDARNGTTTVTYNNEDQIVAVTTPSPGTGQGCQVTSTVYDNSMRATGITHPDGRTVSNEYTTMGMLKKTYGARTYPVEYTYDAQGRMTTMKTWQNYVGNSGTATTTWNYNTNRGWLDSKRYNDNTGPDYTYTAGGRLRSRTWARTGSGGRVTTTYSYGFDGGSYHGDLTAITYTHDPASTPNVTYTYDRRGRRATMSSSADAITFNYYDNGIEGTNSHGSGLLNGYNVTWGYNSAMQLSSLAANTATALSQSFTYDTAGRLNTAADGSYSATYSYVSNSRLVSQIVFKTNTATRLTTTKSWDYLNRLSETRSTSSSSSELPAVFKYGYNDANQRVSATMNDGSYWIYQYDSLGQVTSGRHYWSDGTSMAGQQYDYGFDDIGNRKTAKFGGDANGKNLQSAIYTPSLLNQYTNRTIPAAAPVIGIASAGATVTVNSNSVYRKGEYFWKELAVTNNSAAVWLSITNATVNGTNVTTASGNEYIPQTPEVYSYDLDGNLTADGRWTYSWDAENRLVRMVAATGSGPQQRLDFTYDPMGRRIRKQVWNNTSGTGAASLDRKLIYEQWNLLGEVDALNADANIRTYLWGNDMNGTRGELAGVGGLVGIKNSSGVVQFAAFDGNGNVVRLISGDTGNVSATYEYGAFGELIRLTGSYASANPIRFSTKFSDSETGLTYFGRRLEDSSTGRWLSRDPMDEAGGMNLFSFVRNNPVNSIDPLGLTSYVDEQVGPTSSGMPAETQWDESYMPTIEWESCASGRGQKIWHVHSLLKITMIIQPTYSWKDTSLSDHGFTIKNHELSHVKIFENAEKQIEQTLFGLIGTCRTCQCKEATDYYIEKVIAMAILNANFENARWDCSDYKDGVYKGIRCGEKEWYGGLVRKSIKRLGEIKRDMDLACKCR